MLDSAKCRFVARLLNAVTPERFSRGSIFSIWLFAAVFLFALGVAAPCRADEAKSPPGGSHADLKCADCHAEGDTTHKPKDCGHCHDGRYNPHPVGVVANMPVPDYLPLTDKKITCNTCHIIHGGKKQSGLLRDGTDIYASRRMFCFNCHKDGMAGTDPHYVRSGQSRCLFCHINIPKGGENSENQRPVNATCKFCHGVDDDRHAINFGVTGGPGDKKLCSDCHDPHGTVDSVNFLRPAFAKTLGKGQETSPHKPDLEACRSCHSAFFSDEISREEPKLLYGGNVVMLCLTCHVKGKNHHPTGVPLPQAMASIYEKNGKKLVLEKGRIIVCTTCHDTGCADNDQKMRIIDYDRSEMSNSLCWSCHSRSEFYENNPHTDSPDSCKWCHVSRAVSGSAVEKGLLASPTMVCLQCHEVTPHPGGVAHSGPLTSGFKSTLPMGAGGEMTCTTCHTPHHDTAFPENRLRMHKDRLCRDCHVKI